MSDPSSEMKILTEAVNAHGIFFKRAVRNALEQIPGVQILGEECPIRYLEGASLDLLFAYQTASHPWIFPVECKKAYVAMKRWVFFEDPDPSTRLIYFFRGNDLVYVCVDSIQSLSTLGCIEGIEIDMQKTKTPDSLYRSGSPDTIWKAAFQACKGGLGFLLNEKADRTKYATGQFIEYASIPLIITNAPLFVCDLKTQSVDISTGNHIGDMEIRSVPWLILSHPFTPSQVQNAEYFEVIRSEYQPPQIRFSQAKVGIAVINAKYIGDFLEQVVSPLQLAS